MQISECVVGSDTANTHSVVLPSFFQPSKGIVIVTSSGEHARDLEGRLFGVLLDQFGQIL